jgi:hypothetical protein
MEVHQHGAPPMFMFPLLLLSTSTQGTPDVQNEHPIHPASVNFLYVFLLAQKLSKNHTTARAAQKNMKLLSIP